MIEDASKSIAQLLEAFGLSDHPETDGTPERVARMWSENLLSGYDDTVEDVLGERIPDASGSVLSMHRIPFHGICPHHLVPFFGEVDLSYDPGGQIVGLGALERLVACLSRRLVLQEELTGQLVDTLMTVLGAQGAACRISARHLCFMLRGREPRQTVVVTHAFRGTLDKTFELSSTQPGAD